MGYRIRVVGPAGRVTYLARGKEVEDINSATWYPHPGPAELAAKNHRKRCKGQRVIINVEEWKNE